jgi:hypothetical protein
MTAFNPFQNEADSLTLDDLTIENRLDRLSIYGTLQITRDKAGLKLAQELKSLIDAAVKKMKAEDLPEHVTVTAPDRVDNPFK